MTTYTITQKPKTEIDRALDFINSWAKHIEEGGNPEDIERMAYDIQLGVDKIKRVLEKAIIDIEI